MIAVTFLDHYQVYWSVLQNQVMWWCELQTENEDKINIQQLFKIFTITYQSFDL